MTNERSPRRSLDSLKKEAKRWRDELEAGDAAARARLEKAVPDAPASPALRHGQHALAREHGFSGWADLKAALEQSRTAGLEMGATALAQYDTMAEALLDAYRTGTPEAMERHYRYTWHRRAWHGMRTYVQLDLGKRPSDPRHAVEITIDDARFTNDGVAHLARLGRLKSADVSGRGVTADVVRRFPVGVRVVIGNS